MTDNEITDNRQITLHLVSFALIIITVECAYALGSDISLIRRFILVIALSLSFYVLSHGLCKVGFNEQINDDLVKKYTVYIILSTVSLVVAAFSVGMDSI